MSTFADIWAAAWCHGRASLPSMPRSDGPMRAGTPAVIGAAVGIVLAIVLSCPLSAFAGDRAGDERDDQDQLDALDELPPLRFASDDTGTSGVRRELVGPFI